MSLIRTSALNGVAVAVRMATALVLNKILALLVGPAGYAIIGQFQNVLSVVITFATGAVNTGVTKATAQYHEDTVRQIRLWRTAATVVLACSVGIAILLALFSEYLAQALLGDEDLQSVLVWTSLGLVPISLNALLLAILNGLKDVKRYIICNIAGSILSLFLTGILAWRYGLEGALIALSLNQAVIVLVTIWQVRSCDWYRPREWIGAIDKAELRGLGGFALMAATTALVGPLSQLFVRQVLIDRFGIESAGYWDAMWRISTIYLAFITTTLTLYYLPRIAEIRSWPEMSNELIYVLARVTPVAVALSLTIYILRDFITIALFSRDFEPMAQLFAWQLTGDVLKITAWIFAFLMIGRGLFLAFILTEILTGAVFIASVLYFTKIFGLEGVAVAHCFNYGVYLCVVSYVTIGTKARRGKLLSPPSA